MKWQAFGLIVCGLLCVNSALGDDAHGGSDARHDDYAKPASIPYPSENPYSAAKEALGKLLFFDPILSKSNQLSCASCHKPDLAWGDGRPRAIGATNRPLALRSPTLIDLAFISRFGWDGKFRNLESVAFTPITATGNMALPEGDLIARLSAIPGYGRLFEDAFGDPSVTRGRIEMALATYERSIVASDAPFDKWIAGDESAIDDTAKRGFGIFNGKGHCSGCHSGWAFSDGSFHDIGTAQGKDIGRGRLFPTSVMLQYAFKTPTLRDVARRAPYMHDGSIPTLAAVIDLYDKGGIERPSRSEQIHPLDLSDPEKTDLLAFLQTLTSAPPTVHVPPLPR